ncbi:MAG: hypothetical protein RR521_05340 [Clostridia bacterium]
MCAAYGILLYRLPAKIEADIYPGLLIEFFVAFTTCALFFGVSAMVFSNCFKNTLFGVLFGLLLNSIFTLFLLEPSILNGYLYKAYYSRIDVSQLQIGKTGGASAAQLFFPNFASKKAFPTCGGKGFGFF